MSKINSVSGYESIPPLANNFPIKVRKYKSSRLQPHWHEHLELLYIVGGECNVIVGGKPAEIGRGDIVVVNSTEVHSFNARGGMLEYVCILISPDFFLDVDFSGVMIENYIRDGEAAELIRAMYDEYIEEGRASDMMQKSLAYRLISQLTRSHSAAPLSDRSQSLHRAALSRLDAVLDMVAERYREPLSTKDLADACYLSEAHFCRFFKAATGKTALEYINEYRADRAQVLLEKTSMSLLEIAESVGFEDLNYFCRLYKRIKGTSPGKHRAEIKQR